MSEIRRDPLTGRSVIIAPERGRSFPSFPLVEALDGDMCPFCEGQEGIAGRELLAWRPSGSAADGPGWRLRVVANREPALRVESHLGPGSDALFQAFGGLGAHEVVIESPQHRASFATMTGEEIGRVLWAWRERIRDLRRDVRLKTFVVVKNVGALAGATLDHSHSQLLALPLVPQHVDDELAGAAAYYQRTSRCVFCDILEREVTLDMRVIASDDVSVAISPFAARVPFETWVMPRTHRAAFDEVPDQELAVLGERLGDVMRRLHKVLILPPYTLLLHTTPVGVDVAASYHWHLEIVPRLTPVSGLAWDGGIHINTVPPEVAAEALRQAG
jgi:UDPglucose--hexose-1-phosphate uridylyltransferase